MATTAAPTRSTGESRRLPIPAAHREFTVQVDGQDLPRTHQLLALALQSAANRVASARLAYLDGSAAAGGFALSESALFVPGARVQISAGAGRDRSVLFEGRVVRHALKLRDHSAPQLVIDCRHDAARLATRRRARSWFDAKDSDAIEALLGEAGLAAEVEATTVQHEQLVQFDATDWDFALRRAAAAGLVLFTRAAKVVARKPALDGDPVAQLSFGAVLLELDAEIDARAQAAEHHALSWLPSDQAASDLGSAEPALAAPGNLDTAALADATGTPRRELRHAALPEAEAQAWADAVAAAARLNQVSGRAKCEGLGNVFPGDVIALARCGARFDGRVLVTGVRHSFDTVEGWKTHLQFGGIEAAEQRAAESAPPRPMRGLLPAAEGLQIGIVTGNEDPAGEDRVRVRLPAVETDGDGLWARVASPDAGSERGFFFRPEIGDEVVLGFLDDDPRHPVILGMLHSSARPAPERASDDNPVKLYQSREKLRIRIDDEKKILTLETPGGQKLVLDDDAQGLTLSDQHGNKIVLGPDGIAIESAKAIEVKAATRHALSAGTAFDLSASTQLKLEGSAGAELSSSGVTKVKGSLVQIN